jgi:hypothetical protein
MKIVLMVLGFCGVMVLFFGVVPAAKVDEAVREEPAEKPSGPWSGWGEPGRVIAYKSGLRIAVEGRLKWLGVL